MLLTRRCVSEGAASGGVRCKSRFWNVIGDKLDVAHARLLNHTTGLVRRVELEMRSGVCAARALVLQGGWAVPRRWELVGVGGCWRRTPGGWWAGEG